MRRFLIWYCILSPVIFSIIVAVLGFITPGYDHAANTISELSIGKYGWIQQINLFQLASSGLLISLLFPPRLEHARAATIWRNGFLLCTVVTILLIIFPTESVEKMHSSLFSLSFTGLSHLIIAICFLVISPFGIRLLSDSIKSDRTYGHLAYITRVYSKPCLVCAVVWFVSLGTGIGMRYLGLVEKTAIAILFYWLLSCALTLKRDNRILPDPKTL
ncbi:hypothetical protein AUK40_00650 [Candidatus Wirthbacteria bacterium CG2_30_54_11]|uniref:DUF998 domain-containing protein n=1 Tax=Candidatus Wirthbacteria bacterium CG2_30_54_11 TaxID=1817892 RepID=A0A1J5J839_9BACT|nr:MAG: hypothetical protein AUK40_00650 [Candidatus Wirthbacteria bacterium CG2_30_54_11]